jgi:hypothetical protein
MPERLKPPFTIGRTDEAAWIEDADGKRFGYVYWRDRPIVGTDRSGRLSRELALRTVKWIKTVAEAAAKPDAEKAPRPEPGGQSREELGRRRS